jgi:type IV secretion system protein TrbL
VDIPGIDIPTPGDIIGGIGGFFGGLAEDAAGAIIELVLGVIFGFVADAVAAITAALAPAFNGDSTRVDLVGGWFSSEGGATVTAMTSVIAGSLVLVFLLLALVRALFAGEFSAMWRASLIDVPVAFLGTALTVVIASALLEVVDVSSVTLLGARGDQLSAFSESLADAERLDGAGLLGILFGLLFIIGAVLVWIQLLVRAALIYIVIAFAPILWVTRAYPGTRSISRRGIEVALALILSKFVMAVSFRLGAEALRGVEVTGDEVNLSAMLVGAAIMLLTAFMPFAVFKVIPIVESATAASGADKAAAGAAIVGAGAAIGGTVVAAKLAGAGVGAITGGGGTFGGGGAGVIPGAGGGGGNDGGAAPVGGGPDPGSGGGAAAASHRDEDPPTGATETANGSARTSDGGSSSPGADGRSNSHNGDGTAGAASAGPGFVVEPVGGGGGVGVLTAPASDHTPNELTAESSPSVGGPQPLARRQRSQP